LSAHDLSCINKVAVLFLLYLFYTKPHINARADEKNFKKKAPDFKKRPEQLLKETKTA